ncbi:MAG: hypothetical protein RL148_1955 [Planctomycetota bacterium]
MSFAQPFQDYEILERVGAGAMGTVFRARDRRLGRIVAVKVLKPSLARDERYVQRLRREARIVAALNHPNIVTGHALGEEGGYHYFVMEYVEGESLRTLLQEWGMFPEERVLEVGMEVASALEHAWQRGVIHRDVKPGNVLIDASGRVKLTDMGLAKGPADLDLTRDGTTLGTPQYISPEQVRDPQQVDVRSDLWSLGATLYHMSTGQVPFRGSSLAEVISQVLYETPRPVRELNPAASEGIELVLRKLLVRDPDHRYQTPTELLEDLRRVAGRQAPAVDTRALARAERGRPSGVFRKVAIVALSTCLGFALALVAVQNWGQGTESRVEDESRQRLLDDLGAALAAAGNGSARWSLATTALAQAPVGAEAGVAGMLSTLAGELRSAVDDTVREVRTGWSALESTLASVDVWPSRADVERSSIDPILLRSTGFRCADLPEPLRTQSLAQLLSDLDSWLSQRDRILEDQFVVHLRELATRAAGMVSRGRLREAAEEWEGALEAFGDGVAQPVPARWPAALRSGLEKQLEEQRAAALKQVDEEARRLAAGLASEVAAAIEALGAPSQRPPGAVLEDWRRLVAQLADSYPSDEDFPHHLDPWPDLQPRIAATTLQLESRAAEHDQMRANRIARTCWGGVVATEDPGAGATDALGMLEVTVADPGLRAPLAPLRELLEAVSTLAGGGQVADGVVADVASRVLAAIRARREGGALQSSELLAAGPARFHPALAALAEVLNSVDTRGVVASAAVARVQRAYTAAAAGGPLEAMSSALVALDASGEGLDQGQQALVAELRAWLAREEERRQLLGRIKAAAPPSADCGVEREEGSERLRARVLVPAAGLAAGAGAGWLLQGQGDESMLVLAQSGDPVAQRLETGMAVVEPAEAVRAAVELLSSGEGVTRHWLFSLRGYSVLLVVDATGRVRAATARNLDLANRDAVAALLLRALDSDVEGVWVPGAVHRLELVVRGSSGRTRGTVELGFEGRVLCNSPVDLDRAQAPVLTIHPFAPLGVRSVELVAEGI